MNTNKKIPNTSYGVLIEDRYETDIDIAVNQIRRLGFAVVSSDWSQKKIEEVSTQFELARRKYYETWGRERLCKIDEINTIRCLLSSNPSVFIEVAANQKVMAIISKLIIGNFILNQQNGVINPPFQEYNQGMWHRDLPYQHFTSSNPIAVNSLFCIDNFTHENGATFVLPASHKEINFPSAIYIKNNALQIVAKSGDFIILDCMLYHSGGNNQTNAERRAINNVYTVPYFKQQIRFSGNVDYSALSAAQRKLLGEGMDEPLSIDMYLKNRQKKTDPNPKSGF